MNKKKLAALAISGTLLMGGAGFGAYAWFTSQANANTNLKITTGQFSLLNETKEDTWSQVNAGNTQAEMVKNPTTHVWEINKVQPGDEFTKTVTIQAKGDLNQNVSFDVDNSIKSSLADNGLILTVKNGNQDLMSGEKEMAPDDRVTATITLKVNPELNNGTNDKNMKKVLLQTLEGKFINVNGTQIKPSQPNPAK